MNRENILKWTKELRSGKYKQGRGFLRKNDCFCCLGVATDMWGKRLDPSTDVWNGDNCWCETGVYSVEDTDEYELLTVQVMNWLGLNSREPVINASILSKILSEEEKSGLTLDKHYSVAYLNDQGISFEKIADIIEAQLALEEKYEIHN